MLNILVPALAAAPGTPGLLSLVSTSKPISMAVLVLLILASCFSWGVIFTKWNRLRHARNQNGQFLRAFRKANGFESITAACEQFPLAPLVTVYDYGTLADGAAFLVMEFVPGEDLRQLLRREGRCHPSAWWH